MTVLKQPDISVRDSLNYQNNYRNTFGWLVGLSYKAVKLDIHLCVDGRFSKIRSHNIIIDHIASCIL